MSILIIIIKFFLNPSSQSSYIHCLVSSSYLSLLQLDCPIQSTFHLSSPSIFSIITHPSYSFINITIVTSTQSPLHHPIHHILYSFALSIIFYCHHHLNPIVIVIIIKTIHPSSQSSPQLNCSIHIFIQPIHLLFNTLSSSSSSSSSSSPIIYL